MHVLYFDFSGFKVFDLHLKEGNLLLENRALFDEFLFFLSHVLLKVVYELLIGHQTIGWH